MTSHRHVSPRQVSAILACLIAAASTLSDPGSARAAGIPDGEWGQISFTGSIPDARTEQAAVYDPLRHRMIVVGGYGSGSFFTDVWVLSLGATPNWTQITPSGTPMTERCDHSAIYDPVRDRILVFGGRVPGGPGNDVWALSLAGSPSWSQLTPTGTPPPARFSHSAIYDPVRDRMIVFGGIDQLSCNTGALPFGDVWALSLAGTPSWAKLTPTGAPPAARLDHAALYDPIRDRMVVFGGLTGGFCWCDCGTTFNDAWALSLAGTPAWTLIKAMGYDTDPGRYAHTAVYDAMRDRMLVFGGTFLNYAYNTLNDTWALPLDGSGDWHRLAPYGDPPAYRVNSSAIYDPQVDRMLVFGGQTPAYSNDVWSLYMNPAPLSVEPRGGEVLLVENVAPNPAASQMVVSFSLPSSQPALLELIDLAGRRMAAREVGSLGPGSHHVRLGDPTRIPAGLYFVRLAQDGRRVTAKAAIVH